MAGKKDKSKARISKKDSELWKTLTKDVRRLPGRGYEETDEEEIPDPPAPVRERVVMEPKEIPRQRGSKGKDIDKRTAQRLSRGQMPIEGTLDLHGLGQAEAREALRRFIRSSYERGKRCVLVITGKGTLDRPAILKARVPEWLNEEPLAPLVLKAVGACIQHGGQGAIYVLLRRQRG